MDIKELIDAIQQKYRNLQPFTRNQQFLELEVFTTRTCNSFLTEKGIGLESLSGEYAIEIRIRGDEQSEDRRGQLPADILSMDAKDANLNKRIEEWCNNEIIQDINYSIILRSSTFFIRIVPDKLDTDNFGIIQLNEASSKFLPKNPLKLLLKFVRRPSSESTQNVIKQLINNYFTHQYKIQQEINIEYPSFLQRKIDPFEKYLIAERQALTNEKYKPKAKYSLQEFSTNSDNKEEEISEDPASLTNTTSTESPENVGYWLYFEDEVPPRSLTEAGNLVSISIGGKQDPHKKKINFKIESYDLENQCLVFTLKENVEKLKEAPKKGFIQLENNTTNNRRKQEAIALLKKPNSSSLYNLTDLLLRPDVFSPISLESIVPINKKIDPQNPQTKTQYEALQAVFSSPDLTLIQGPPGSGKTTIICELIQQVLRNNGRVLACAPTHVAIDNILERLDKEPGFHLQAVRIGRPQRIDRDMKKYLLENIRQNWFRFVLKNKDIASQEAKNEMKLQKSKLKKSIKPPAKDKRNDQTIPEQSLDSLAEIQQYFLNHIGKRPFIIDDMILNSCNLICGTSTGVVSIYESGRMISDFDLMIIDESSKATILEFLIPATRAKKWVIVGDQNQLPPYIEDREVKVFFQNYFEKTFAKELSDWNAKAENELRNLKHRDHTPDFRQSRDIKVDPFVELLMTQFKRYYEEFHFIGKDSDRQNAYWQKICQWVNYNRQVLLKFRDFISILGSCYHYFFSKIENSRKRFLDYQYRMPELVNSFISTNFYQNKLKSAEVAKFHGFRFHSNLLLEENNFLQDMAFISTSNLPSEERTDRSSRGSNSWSNEAEKTVVVRIINQIYQDFTNLGDVNKLWAREDPRDGSRSQFSLTNPLTIGVINFYSGQARIISNAMKELPFLTKKGKNTWVFTKAKKFPVIVRVSIVDRFQGQEQDIIIIPMVRSNNYGRIGFLESRQRANVAFSRVKNFLFIVGDSNFFQTLRPYPRNRIYINLIDHCRKNKVLYYIPKENSQLKRNNPPDIQSVDQLNHNM